MHGRTSQIRVSLTSLHSSLLLVTLVEMPVPHVLEHWDQGVVWTMHFGLSNTWTSGCGLNAVIKEAAKPLAPQNALHAEIPQSNQLQIMMKVFLPGRDLSPPLPTSTSSFLLVRSLSSSSLNVFLPKIFSRISVSLPSSHTHSSQHWPATLTSLGLAQPRLGRESSCGHRGTHPTAPSMHVHWCLQLGWKLSPFW